MFSFRKLGGAKVCPIGIDFGAASIKLAQVRVRDGSPEVTSAVSLPTPSGMWQTPATLSAAIDQLLRDATPKAGFKGRQVVLGLPASQMSITRVRLSAMDDEQTQQALQWEVLDRIPYNPTQALLRHVVAGQVYVETDQKNEVIVMAAKKAMMNALLEAMSSRMEVVGMSAEPTTCVELLCEPNAAARIFVDLGMTGSRIYIARGSKLVFARMVPIGGAAIHDAIVTGLKLNPQDVRLMRQRLPGLALTAAGVSGGAADDASDGVAFASDSAAAQDGSDAAHDAANDTGSDDILDPDLRRVDRVSRRPIRQLAQEINRSRLYYEQVFAGSPVDRIVFLGGQTAHRRMCQQIASQVGLPGTIANPLARIPAAEDASSETMTELARVPAAWAVAIGLSAGSPQAT